MMIERGALVPSCRQRLDARTYRGVAAVVMDDVIRAGGDPTGLDLKEAERRFIEAAELAGVCLHGMGTVTCCGGCGATFQTVWCELLDSLEAAV